jgi:large subunit ribosomal protein L4
MRAPQFRGGAVVFGPKPRDHSTDLPVKVRNLGMRVALSVKYAQDDVVFVDQLALEEGMEGRAREFRTILQGFGWTPNNKVKNVLLVASSSDEMLERASRNFEHVHLLPAEQLTVLDVLKHDKIVRDTGAVEALAARVL